MQPKIRKRLALLLAPISTTLPELLIQTLATIIPPSILVIISLLGLKYWDPFLDNFRLSGKNTVLDHHNSSIKDVVDWTMRMCNDGKCLDHSDWMCGFNIEELDLVSVCVTDTVEQIDKSTSLDTLRKYCGKKYAVFTGRHGSPERCAKAGGIWGEITN